jgi:hypothetical protein
MQCSGCGHENREGRRFCAECYDRTTDQVSLDEIERIANLVTPSEETSGSLGCFPKFIGPLPC